jgi:hypothetical protein
MTLSQRSVGWVLGGLIALNFILFPFTAWLAFLVSSSPVMDPTPEMAVTYPWTVFQPLLHLISLVLAFWWRLSSPEISVWAAILPIVSIALLLWVLWL